MSALRVPSKSDIVSKGRRLSNNHKILRTSFELVQSEGGEGGGRVACDIVLGSGEVIKRRRISQSKIP